ncbi:MAG: hypothetical protein AAGK05_11445, partial [Pseudomonadota bacterium]
ACLASAVIPRFVCNMTSLPDNITSNKAVARKLQSLEMEVLRTCLTEYREKLESLEQQRGYEYLTLTQSRHHVDLQRLFTLLKEDVRGEERDKFERHKAKWSRTTDRPFSMCQSDYECDIKPKFPFNHADAYLYSEAPRRGKPENPRDVLRTDFCNDTEYVLPNELTSLLNRGPNFRIPPNLNKKNFLENVQLSLDRLTYNLRWRHKINDDLNEDNSVGTKILDNVSQPSLKIPFQKNSVKLPPSMENEKEVNLLLFKEEVFKTVKDEVSKTKKSVPYKCFSRDLKISRKFVDDNDLAVVATDKTSRLCVTSNAEMTNRTENILEDNSTYKMLNNSKKVALEKQANKLIDNVYKNKLSKSNLQRLHSTGSQPANFYALIKDHKNKSNGFFPLRPIASVHSTPTNKIDWICGRILNQLVQYVPAHLPSSSALIEDFKNLSNSYLNADSVFVSLDVVNLYPSVPISSALKVVSNFAREHWSKIDTLNMSEEQFLKLLTFVSYNYEIQYNNKVYLQIKGCPMGSHYAPPFAIIFMNHVESKALTLLQTEFNCIGLQNNSILYKRYIDDSIFGPFKRNQAFFERILTIFNSIDENIKFTLESPSNDR